MNSQTGHLEVVQSSNPLSRVNISEDGRKIAKYAEVQQAACAEDRPEKTAVRYTKQRRKTVAVIQRVVVFGLPE